MINGMQVASTATQFIETKLSDIEDVKILTLPRQLTGEFNGLASKLGLAIGISKSNLHRGLSPNEFAEIVPSLELTAPEQQAAIEILSDTDLLKDFNPRINIEHPTYGNNDPALNWHTDASQASQYPIEHLSEEDLELEKAEGDFLIIAYNQSATEYLDNENARRIQTDLPCALYEEIVQGESTWHPQTGDITKHKIITHFQQEDCAIHRRPRIISGAPRITMFGQSS